MTITLRPIAVVRSPRKEVVDDDWGEVASVIELSPDLDEDSLVGIEDFSHVEVIFFFDQIPDSQVEYGARHPRGNREWPRVGVFAQRCKYRPNRLGATIARLSRREGRRLHVVGLDAIDGTPVLDLKPVMREFLPREPVTQPRWAVELMRQYWTRGAGPRE